MKGTGCVWEGNILEFAQSNSPYTGFMKDAPIFCASGARRSLSYIFDSIDFASVG